jgi:hypothetical protein
MWWIIDVGFSHAIDRKKLNVRYAKELFWVHSMVLLGDEGQVEPLSIRLEIVLILTQDRCMVCAEHTIGSKIVLDAPDGTPR